MPEIIDVDRKMVATRTIREGPGVHRKSVGYLREGQVAHFAIKSYQLREPKWFTRRAGDMWYYTPGKPCEYPAGWVSLEEHFSVKA